MKDKSGLPIGDLLFTVFNSILEVSIVCVAGYVLAGRGVLDKRMQKQLNKLNINLFTPCLLLSKVALTLSPAKLRELWIVPIFWAIITFLSMASAYALGVTFKLRTMHRNFAMAAAMFMNSNSLPVALMQSLVLSVQGLKWGPDDTGDAMLGRALSYLVIAYALGMVLRWSFGVHLLSIPAEEHQGERPRIDSDVTSEASSEDEDLVLPSAPFSTRRPLQSFLFSRPRSSMIRGRFKVVHSAFVDIMSPPLFAAIVSIIIAMIPPVQDILAHHMQPVKRALSGTGNCSIPCTLLVLGAYFYEFPKEKAEPQANIDGADSEDFLTSTDDDRGDQPSSGLALSLRRISPGIPRWMKEQNGGQPERKDETKAITIAVISRMLIAPALLLPIIIWCARGEYQEVFEDPVFVVTNILLVSSPSAVTLAQLTPAASGDAFERLISRTIFWSYCIITPPATILYLVVGLSLARI